MRTIFISLAVMVAMTAASAVNKQCRELLACSIKKKCVNLPWLIDQLQDKEISLQMYNDIDQATDYGCIFTAGCQDECNKCPLCHNSKMQVVEILSGGSVTEDMECPELIKCATDCVAKSANDLNMINRCLRHTCAFHCFDGSCPKCSAFVTRVFNQMCISGDLRNTVKNFKGQCYEMFREIVYSKFKKQFDDVNMKPSIGSRQ